MKFTFRGGDNSLLLLCGYGLPRCMSWQGVFGSSCYPYRVKHHSHILPGNT